MNRSPDRVEAGQQLPDLTSLAAEVARRGTPDAVSFLSRFDPPTVAGVLRATAAAIRFDVLEAFAPFRREAVLDTLDASERQDWLASLGYPSGSVGRLMDRPVGLFAPQTTVAEATEAIRPLVKQVLVTYLFVVDSEKQLLGVVAMRELLLGDPSATLEQVMVADPFFLTSDMDFATAMKASLNFHFPIYPVCEQGRLVGLIRGQTLFAAGAFEISAQAGRMVGVEKEERLSTSWRRSLLMRHPWLQFNLLTAFVAATVVGMFEGTLDRLVILAVFLPVLAGQSGNTGCQALAVTLRSMALGQLVAGRGRRLILKEAWLGLLNGMLVGVSAGAGMWFYASTQKQDSPLLLGFVVFAAMTGACLVSGMCGALVPMVLKRLGADPATASSIFLTTATDVVSMGFFLGLATVLIQ